MTITLDSVRIYSDLGEWIMHMELNPSALDSRHQRLIILVLESLPMETQDVLCNYLLFISSFGKTKRLLF